MLNEIENMNPESLCKIISALALMKAYNTRVEVLLKKIVRWVT